MKCDDHSLEALLDADDVGADFHDITEHVESCEHCQARLGQLAAEAGQWDEAKKWLSRGDVVDECEADQADVKPSNILLERGVERALLTDFGLARACDDASLPHTSYHPGTPQYMSPEQARGESVPLSLVRLILGATFALTMIFAGVLIVLELNKAKLTIESEVDDVAVRITQGDRIVEKLTITRSGASVRIAAGQYVVEIDGQTDGITVENGIVKLQRGGREVVKIVKQVTGKGSRSPGRFAPEEARPAESLPAGQPMLAATLPDHLNVMAVAFSQDGEHVISLATEQEVAVRWWDLRSATVQRTAWLETKVHGNRFAGSAGTTISANGKTIAAIIDGKVNVWSAETGRLRRTLRAPEGNVHPWVVAVSPDGSLIAATGGSGLDSGFPGGIEPSAVSVLVWKTESAEVVRKLEHGGAQQIHCLGFSHDGKRLASGSWKNGAKIWEIGSGEMLQTVAIHSTAERTPKEESTPGGDPDAHQAVLSVAFSPDGRLLATGDLTGVKLWNVPTGHLVYALNAPYKLGRAALVFSADGERLARAATDTTVFVWKVKTGELTSKIEGDSNCAAFSPDRCLLAVGLSDKTQALKIWRLPRDKTR